MSNDRLEAELSEYMDELLNSVDYCGCDACYWHSIVDFIKSRLSSEN